MTPERDTAGAERVAVVCGAGIAGLTTAWWLARDDWEVVLVERASGLRTEGYLIDFFGAGYDVARKMGIRSALERAAYDVDYVASVNGRGERTALIDYQLVSQLLDGRLLSLMRGDLERVLSDALPGSVDLRYDCTVADIQQDVADGVRVDLSDGSSVDADLLVGADGVHSRVRELAFGPESAYLRDLGYRTGAYIFEDAAFSERLDDPFQLLSVPNLTAGVFALRDGSVSVWFAYRVDEAAGRPSDPSDPCTALASAFDGVGWVVPDALAHCGDGSVYFDQVAQVEMEAWSSGRVVLVGDAAGAVSLLAGQGSSVAMTTAYVLARELRGPGGVEDALVRYAETMRPDVTAKQAGGRRAANYFMPPTRWHLAVRNAVLNLSRLPGLGRLLSPIVSTAGGIPGEE